MENIKNRTKAIKIAIVSAVAVHVYGVHAKLLYAINPDKPKELAETVYSFIALNEATITTEIFALVYAIATAGILILFSEHRRWLQATTTFALLDGLGVFIYYNTEMNELFTIFSSAYYAIYTLCIILFIGLHYSTKQSYEHMDDVILSFKTSGMSDREISEKLNIPVRIIKNFK